MAYLQNGNGLVRLWHRDPHIKEGSQWIAAHAVGRHDAAVWTIRGITEAGVYITCPESRSPGHLFSQAQFLRLYVPRAA